MANTAAERLRSWLDAKRGRGQQLADACGVTRQGVWGWAENQGVPNAEYHATIAKLTGIKPDAWPPPAAVRKSKKAAAERVLSALDKRT